MYTQLGNVRVRAGISAMCTILYILGSLIRRRVYGRFWRLYSGHSTTCVSGPRFSPFRCATRPSIKSSGHGPYRERSIRLYIRTARSPIWWALYIFSGKNSSSAERILTLPPTLFPGVQELLRAIEKIYIRTYRIGIRRFNIEDIEFQSSKSSITSSQKWYIKYYSLILAGVIFKKHCCTFISRFGHVSTTE